MARVTFPTDGQVLGVSAVGLVGGVVLLVRGFGGYRRAARIGDTATSRISALAVGEVRVTGTVEPAEVQLTSPLQSRQCVYYRATVTQSEGRDRRRVFHEERSVGFKVRDGSGSLRVFPLGATWDIPERFSDHDRLVEGRPIELNLRTGPAITMSDPATDPAAVADARRSAAPDGPGSLADPYRAMQVAELLTVRMPEAGSPSTDSRLAGSRGGRDYHEATLVPGDIVTVVGTVLPFDQLPDPTEADEESAVGGPLGAADIDPEIAADLAAATAAGTLAGDSKAAWGNAAIPGFGIGRPVSAPVLDPDADAPVITADVAALAAIAAQRTFDIAPEALVLAAGPASPLLIAAGPPGASAGRGDRTFLIGLLGAVVSIVSAMTIALAVAGGALR